MLCPQPKEPIMKLLSFQLDGQASYGLLRGDDIVDLGRRFFDAPTLQALIAQPDWLLRAAAHAGEPADHRRSEVRLLPVIPEPRTIACVGHNYEEHRVETQRDPTAHPSIFFRGPESL